MALCITVLHSEGLLCSLDKHANISDLHVDYKPTDAARAPSHILSEAEHELSTVRPQQLDGHTEISAIRNQPAVRTTDHHSAVKRGNTTVSVFSLWANVEVRKPALDCCTK